MRCLVSFALALTLAAQDAPFGVQSRLVLVPVNVTDSKGRTVDGLESKDFVVLDNGRPQKATVDTAATGVAPIALVVAIQTSGISKAVLEKVRKIGVMIQPLVMGERGCAAVVAFSDRIDWIQECTNSDDSLAHAFEQVRPGADKSARMLDAVYESVQRLRQRPNSRRDPTGCPDPPTPPPEQRVDLLGGIGELVRFGKTNAAQALTKGTGGVTFPFARLKGLEEAIQKLGAELQSQYVLSFTPEDRTPGHHTLDVRVDGFRIRARPGYWSTQPSAR